MSDILNILSNKPLNDLNENNDFFNILPKAQIIERILKNHPDQLNKVNMLALYGNWGSGKTSVIKYLENNLKGSYSTVFFEAWKYENDNNLILSLLELILDKTITTPIRDLENDIRESVVTLLTFAKNLALNTNITLPFMKADIGQAGRDTIEKLTNENKKVSFYSQVEEFKNVYKDIINEFAANRRVIVFIDDLDRCEPKNVLKLLSAIKLFFTYDEDQSANQILFFCALDPLAVKKAVATQYQDVIKSEEYLEKIFDITFNMPESHDLSKLINYCFTGDSEKDYEHNSKLNHFLTKIKFTNPRQVKKVFNKYNLLKAYITDELTFYKSDKYPSIDDNNIILVIFIIYLIILHEFYKDKFNDLYFYQEKLNFHAEKASFDNMKITSNRGAPTREALNIVSSYIPELTVQNNMFTEHIQENDFNNIVNLIHLFSPKYVEQISNQPFANNTDIQSIRNSLQLYINQFSSNSNKIVYDFCEYLIFISRNFTKYGKSLERFKVYDLFEIIKLYL